MDVDNNYFFEVSVVAWEGLYMGVLVRNIYAILCCGQDYLTLVLLYDLCLNQW